MTSRRSGLAMVENDYQVRRARSLVDIPTGVRTAPHVFSNCPACEDPWVGKIHRSLSSADLAPIRRPIVDPPIASPDYIGSWYRNAYKAPWYDRSRQYYWGGGYMSPRRYYPSPIGGYTYISSPASPQLFYPNDWWAFWVNAFPARFRYHKFRSIPVAIGTDPSAIARPYSTSIYDYDYLPREALTGTLEPGPDRAFAAWRMGLLDYATLDRYWLHRDSTYRKLALSNRYPHNYADYTFGSYYRRSRPWRFY